MKHSVRSIGLRLIAAVVGMSLISACQSQDRLTVVEPDGGQAPEQSAADPGGKQGERRLTVVEGAPGPNEQQLVVDGTHRISASHIEAWLSEEELRITMTEMVKEATETEEPEYAYTPAIVNLNNGVRRELSKQEKTPPAAQLVKEQVSPDGKYSFVQKWRDKYTADNFIKNLQTGELIPVKGDNYMEIGGWLDSDTYVLAAGSMQGKGDIRLIATDGSYSNMDIEDEHVESYLSFGASKGRIYYTDMNHVLKVIEPGQTEPVHLIDHVWSFDISPNGEYIAVTTTAEPGGNQGSELLIYDASGNLQGSLIGKGNLVSYVSWSTDSAKLAFDVYSENESGMNGVYVFDTASGKVTWLAPYYSSVHPAAHPVYPLSWSPSGKKLGITTEDKESLLVTQIVEFR
ncbi:WD40 repeat domain-containing protein [Paenibacillus ihbetae]|uniref:WD40 repeat domain-containing protein n=1 Tax=Paenibacillus ihbetae TaxID=1870820 RepID=A0A1B2E5Q5_9BACL|nr:hypothetical protein [Paenibacillus ihbetae]ANY75310.1 hypothetical protein BBD41_23545 [Paenibacillus ihbetae]OOC62522.1 hypothetical protein BBD40_12015 [Paenibacillus ihbetae]